MLLEIWAASWNTRHPTNTQLLELFLSTCRDWTQLTATEITARRSVMACAVSDGWVSAMKSELLITGRASGRARPTLLAGRHLAGHAAVLRWCWRRAVDDDDDDDDVDPTICHVDVDSPPRPATCGHWSALILKHRHCSFVLVEDSVVSCEFRWCWRHLPHAPHCRYLIAFSQAVPTHESRRSPTCLSIGQSMVAFLQQVEIRYSMMMMTTTTMMMMMCCDLMCTEKPNT